MPETTSASNALPSSINSSTLSESTLSTLDRPCRSPDCNPEDCREKVDELDGWPSFRFFLLVPTRVFPPLVVASAFFLPEGLLGMAFLFANFFGVRRFSAGCLDGDFLPALFFELVDFFFVFFLVAIRAV